MEIIRGIENYNKSNKPVYLALGNFDGVHQGHQRLLTDLINKAHTNNGIASAFIFDPHPARVISPHKAPKLLVSAERKAELMSELGLDLLIYNSFTADIAKWSPEEFVRRILVERLCIAEAFVGFNYSFGHKGAGNPDLLTNLGRKYNFKVNVIQPVEVEGEIVSSSLVRILLASGDIVKAKKMLGYYPVIEGEVIEGERRGHTIGFPTANLKVDPDIMVPGKGVYAARVLVDNKYYKCVVNIGSKPTFHEEFPVSIEAHLIDFNAQIYGQSLKLCFLEKIRDEKKFRGVEELVKQIIIDRDKAKDIVSF